MVIELLQDENDVQEFVAFLYNQSTYLLYEHFDGHGYSSCRLSRIQAESKLLYDLSSTGSLYYVCRDCSSEQPEKLLEYLSCGKQAHQRYANTRGRIAGLITDHPNEMRTEATITFFKSVKKHIRQKYSYKEYNPKMSCYFGPHYDSAGTVSYELNKDVCTLHLWCDESRCSILQAEAIEKLNSIRGIDVYGNASIPDWTENGRVRISIDFLADKTDELKTYEEFMIELCSCPIETNRHDLFRYSLTSSDSKNMRARLFIEHPWRSVTEDEMSDFYKWFKAHYQ